MHQANQPQVVVTPTQPTQVDLDGVTNVDSSGNAQAGDLAGARSVLKGIGIALGLAATLLPAATCRAEARLSTRDEMFLFWGQGLALVPGLPGAYLRKCFYHLTLRSCSLSCTIGFLSHINDRRSEVGRGVYIGSRASIGLATLGDGCLIGTRAGIYGGGAQHQLGPDGRPTPFDRAMAGRVRVGEQTWIGEAATLMADVGCRCIVSAGAVISSPVPDGCLVGGNPARFIKKLT